MSIAGPGLSYLFDSGAQYLDGTTDITSKILNRIVINFVEVLIIIRVAYDLFISSRIFFISIPFSREIERNTTTTIARIIASKV